MLGQVATTSLSTLALTLAMVILLALSKPLLKSKSTYLSLLANGLHLLS
jgi:hypothetical protein